MIVLLLTRIGILSTYVITALPTQKRTCYEYEYDSDYDYNHDHDHDRDHAPDRDRDY